MILAAMICGTVTSFAMITSPAPAHGISAGCTSVFPCLPAHKTKQSVAWTDMSRGTLGSVSLASGRTLMWKMTLLRGAVSWCNRAMLVRK
jgi:hypothetical protein